MMKLLDRLGEWVLRLLRIVFVPKATRRKLDAGRSPAARPTAASTETADSGSRQALIAKAVSLHREKQDVLSKLDDKSRRKLTAMAHRMMSRGSPPGGRKGP